MPPKKPASKKTVQKEKKKIVEDKTFGLKNKNKSAKVQKYVQTVQKQVDHQLLGGKKGPLDKKEKNDELNEFLTAAFKPAVQQKPIEKGVDPKSVLCEFFKQGHCARGNKCKYSHDLAIERKAAKIDLYTDARQEDNETNEDWDQQKLEDVVQRKHGAQNENKTDIVCKYFIEAVEAKKYGWFWNCPNGDSCKYRHALPPGYVFKKDAKKEEEEEIDVVTQIEEERKQIKTHTPVTLERFLEWKKKKMEVKNAELESKRKQRKADIKSGKIQMSGRELFAANADLFVDDEGAAEESEMVIVEEAIDPSIPVNIITATGTSITLTAVPHKTIEEVTEDGNNNDPVGAIADQIDESLFCDEGLDDLDVE